MSNKKYCGLCNVWHDPSKEVHQCLVRLDYKCGFNDALEQVAKWMDEKAHGGYAYDHDAFVYAAHVRSMKKP